LLVYFSQIPLIRNLFRNRVETALTFASLNDDSVLLDIGCHSGFLLQMIREQNLFSKYFAIDISRYDIMRGKENCYFEVADARRLPFLDNFFDLVFVLDVLEHIPEIDVAINEIHQGPRAGWHR